MQQTKKGLICRICEQHIQLTQQQKKNNPTGKWAEDLNRHFSKEDIHVQQAHGKMLNITNYQRNVNQNYNENLLTLVRMSVINKSTNNKCWGGCGEKGTLLHWRGCRLVQPLGKTVWRYLRKLQNYHMIQQSHSWAHIWTNLH